MKNITNINHVVDGCLADRLAGISARMKTAQANPKLLQNPHITLVAASKTQPREVIEEAINAGITRFGENRVQEAQEKWLPLKVAYGAVKLHLIGALQSNKAKEAVMLFDVIESLDRENLVDALAKEEAKLALTREYYLQVNTGEEPQKAGVTPAHAAALLAYARKAGLTVTGLMCIPPEGKNPAPHFALLHEMAKTLGLPNLSMGMSGDFETAIRFGATHIRLGTALFGERG